jgi:hypothetical protein
MHPDHVAKLLKSPRLAGVDNAPVPPQPSRLVDTYDASMDATFEQAAATYEAGKSNRRFERDSPLGALSVDPIGKLWYAAWSICLLGGSAEADAINNVRLLLPVLLHSKSPFVLDLGFRALRSIHRQCKSSLGDDLYKELDDALKTYSIAKLKKEAEMIFRDPANAYRTHMDGELEALETSFKNWQTRYPGGIPGATHTPAGWLFNRMVRIEASSGWDADLTTDTENLLPILLNTTSSAVRKRAHSALTIVYTASAQSVNIYLRTKLAEALANAVQKMDGAQ